MSDSQDDKRVAGLSRITLKAAVNAPLEKGRLSALLLSHGSMQLRYYVPPKPDPQTPHRQDELYIVTDGEAVLVSGDQRYRVSRGDVLFVGAGIEHRFEDATSDFGTWVVFYGAMGGEASGSSAA